MKKWKRHLAGFLLAAILCTVACGCGVEKTTETTHTSMGVDDGIGGFLYNFDPSEEVRLLVQNKNNNIFPKSMSWYYERGGTAREENEEVENNFRSSTDAALIKNVYYALSNTIILGIATDQSEFTHYFIAFALPGGKECRYDFVNENTIRLSGQNYVVETDGSLWKSLIAGNES